jgi:hypothetical protein
MNFPNNYITLQELNSLYHRNKWISVRLKESKTGYYTTRSVNPSSTTHKPVRSFEDVRIVIALKKESERVIITIFQGIKMRVLTLVTPNGTIY